MKKRRTSKAKNQTYHFKKRCDERLGVQINRKSIQRRIQQQNYDEDFYFLGKQSNRVTRYRYRFENKWYIIPYDKNTHKVVTIFEDNKQDPILEKIETRNLSQIIVEKFTSWSENIIQVLKNLFVEAEM